MAKATITKADFKAAAFANAEYPYRNTIVTTIEKEKENLRKAYIKPTADFQTAVQIAKDNITTAINDYMAVLDYIKQLS